MDNSIRWGICDRVLFVGIVQILWLNDRKAHLESQESLGDQSVELKAGPLRVCLVDRNVELQTRLAGSVTLYWCWRNDDHALWLLRQLRKNAIWWFCPTRVVQWSWWEVVGTAILSLSECREPYTQIWSWGAGHPQLRWSWVGSALIWACTRLNKKGMSWWKDFHLRFQCRYQWYRLIKWPPRPLLRLQPGLCYFSLLPVY